MIKKATVFLILFLILSEIFGQRSKRESISNMVKDWFFPEYKVYVEYKIIQNKSRILFEIARMTHSDENPKFLFSSDTISSKEKSKGEIKYWVIDETQLALIEYKIQNLEIPYVGTSDTSLYTQSYMTLSDSVIVHFEVLNKIDTYYDIRTGIKLNRRTSAYVPTVTKMGFMIKGRIHWVGFKDANRIFWNGEL